MTNSGHQSEGAGAFRPLNESQIPSRASAPEEAVTRKEPSFGESKHQRFALLKSAKKWVPQVWIFRPGKATNRDASFYLKITQTLLLAVAVCFSVGATDASSRFNDLGHRLMCTCSCAQLLGECNHVGCPESGHMRDELSAAIASGATDEQILTSFAAKYGATVLAAPTTHGFDLVAWIAPFAVFAAALLGTILLVRHWSVGRTQPAELSNPTMDALREKIRRETGSGIDGGI